MIILYLNMALYLPNLGLFLTDKCAVFEQTLSVVLYDPASFSNSEIQKLHVFFPVLSLKVKISRNSPLGTETKWSQVSRRVPLI